MQLLRNPPFQAHTNRVPRLKKKSEIYKFYAQFNLSSAGSFASELRGYFR